MLKPQPNLAHSLCFRRQETQNFTRSIIFVTPFYLQPVPVHTANCVKLIQWHVKERSVALFYI
jgi:hypothetical protein